ncbi:MAG: hypothetical protein EP330_30400 [Deltaproteobacteria bacterium]|nr:MAG: hypothetical protein EP330_30400 [Deltaproteobacteria bacterium]
MLSLLLGLAFAAPVLEIPVEGTRQGARTVRRLADLGYGASVVRSGRDLRVRLDVQPLEPTGARDLADQVTASLGMGVLILGDEPSAILTARATAADTGLAEQLERSPVVHFWFTRELVDGGQAVHDWWADGDRRAVAITTEGEGLVSSRILLDGDRARLWTADGPQSASPEQVREWVEQLGPNAVLADALAVGFGGRVTPDPGCVNARARLLCIEEPSDLGGEVTLFRGSMRTADGRWMPVEIEWYSAGNLVDRVSGVGVDFPASIPEAWFDLENERIDLTP